MALQTPDIKDMRFARDLEEEHIRKMLEISTTREFAARELLFEEYEELRSVYINMEGTVVLGLDIPKKGRINIGTIHPESIFAWSALFPPYLSTASALCITPVRVLEIPAEKLKQLLEADQVFGYRFMKMISNTISQRLSDTRLQLANAITI